MMPSAEADADADADSTEWEYEYDDDETEDVYFTLDLSTCRPTQSTPKPTATRPHSSNNTAPGDIQILHLHTATPLVLFDNTLYSCDWSSTLGTQFYLAPSGTVQPVLRDGHVVDVIGLSRAKLIGTPGVLREPDQPVAAATAGGSVESAITVDDAENLSDDDDAGDEEAPADVSSHDDGTGSAQQRFAALRQNTSDPTIKARASFLERLSSIKQQRGDTDSIPFYGVKNYRPLSDEAKDAIRQSSLAADGVSPVAAAPSTGQSKKRGPYRKCQSTTTTDTADAASPKRKKPGPKSASEIRSAVGLEGGTSLAATLQRLQSRDPSAQHEASAPTASGPPASTANGLALADLLLPSRPKEGDAAQSMSSTRPG